MSKSNEAAAQPGASTPRAIQIELLSLDPESCTRCVGTAANIEMAVDAVRLALEATGTTVRFHQLIIASEQQARDRRFVSSPTIRIDGRDIVVETLESRCDSCTDLCGCSEGTSCRLWRYQGVEHSVAPVGLIVEALLREIVGPPPMRVASEVLAAYQMPNNLRELFAGRAAKPAAVEKTCCGPSEQASCCEPPEKAACCGGHEPASCGCR